MTSSTGERVNEIEAEISRLIIAEYNLEKDLQKIRKHIQKRYELLRKMTITHDLEKPRD